MNGKSIRYERDLPLGEPCDVAVCGGGPAGCAAALSASRSGARVVLLESQGQLGGAATSGLVSHWLGGRTRGGDWVVGGLFRELAEAAAAEGFALLPTADAHTLTPHGWIAGLAHGVPFDPFAMARLLDKTLAAAGVDVVLATQAVDALVEDDRISHVVAHNKSGLQAIPASAVVDATGDADLAHRTGCPVLAGREEDGLMAPASLEFHVCGVDQDALAEYIAENKEPRFRALIADLRERGQWPFPYDIFISVQLQEKGTMMINTTRLVDVNGTEGRSVSDGLVRGREEVAELFAVMRRHIPGFAGAHLKAVAPMLGVRESRRIEAQAHLTVEDVRQGRDWPDTIGYSAYGWDMPDPKRPSHQPFHGKGHEKPPFTAIPFGVMVPRGVDNIVCPGRAIGVEREVLGPLRVMAPCMAMGEAAGMAAAVVAGGGRFAELDAARLCDGLRRAGAIVDSQALPAP